MMRLNKYALGLLTAGCLVAVNAHAVCDLEMLNFYTKNGALQPVPRSSGCNMQLSAAAGAVDSTTLPTGAKYMKVSYVGDARLVVDSGLNKFGSTAPTGRVTDGTAWPLKPTFFSLDAVSGTALTVVKAYGVTNSSSTLEFYK